MHSKPLPDAFVAKKAKILASLSQSDVEYTDKSPKGSIDAPIIDLIGEINRFDGLVTTSSCSGRVAVFVEGEHFLDRDESYVETGGDDDDDDDDASDDGGDDKSQDMIESRDEKSKQQRKKVNQVRTGPGGKGGGRWLFVSHDPVTFPSPTTKSTITSETQAIGTEANTQFETAEDHSFFTRLCGLQGSRNSDGVQVLNNQPDEFTSQPQQQSSDSKSIRSAPRLIHLTFSPLILHILTADLSQHARPLLAAAINAGFRESGVQSLSVLAQNNNNNNNTNTKNSTTGTMVAIRTAGLNFETVIGRLHNVSNPNSTQTEEVIEPLVSEEYLRMCFGVINERFVWNEKRKEKLRIEIAGAFRRVEGELGYWEDKEDRRRRKREEGLRRREEQKKVREEEESTESKDLDTDGLFVGVDV